MNNELHQLVDGVRRNDRSILGKAISLIESHSEKHRILAAQLLQEILPNSGKSLRIGISGMPGAGKSTLIDTLGSYLIEQGHKLAVLAIDPSSGLSGGSILGDKTRMEKLNRSENCFIRPSPAGGTLGGVTRKTRESMLILEAAGYDFIIVETVGVGQSEYTVRSMVDFFILLQIPGSGDELQGIKKGIMEITDLVLINKADGERKALAGKTRQDFAMAVHYLQPASAGWSTKAATCSALTGEGIPDIYDLLIRFREQATASGFFEERRRLQRKDWLQSTLESELFLRFYQDKRIAGKLAEFEKAVCDGQMSVAEAAGQLLRFFYKD